MFVEPSSEPSRREARGAEGASAPCPAMVVQYPSGSEGSWVNFLVVWVFCLMSGCVLSFNFALMLLLCFSLCLGGLDG